MQSSLWIFECFRSDRYWFLSFQRFFNFIFWKVHLFYVLFPVSPANEIKKPFIRLVFFIFKHFVLYSHAHNLFWIYYLNLIDYLLKWFCFFNFILISFCRLFYSFFYILFVRSNSDIKKYILLFLNMNMEIIVFLNGIISVLCFSASNGNL